MNTEERGELASLYALGLLEGDELIAFQGALKQDPALQALVHELTEASNLLAKALPRYPVSPALRDTILQQVAPPDPIPEPAGVPRERISYEWVKWIPWAIAALLAIFCGFLSLGKSRSEVQVARLTKDNGSLQLRLAGLESERNRLEARIATLENERNDLKTRVASVEGRDPLKEVQTVTLAPQPGAPVGSEVTVLWDQRKQAGVLELSKLPPPPADHSYQLWVITTGSPQPVNVGVLASTGPRATFRAPRTTSPVAALAISLEPVGGSPTPTTVLYLGRM